MESEGRRDERGIVATEDGAFRRYLVERVEGRMDVKADVDCDLFGENSTEDEEKFDGDEEVTADDGYGFALRCISERKSESY